MAYQWDGLKEPPDFHIQQMISFLVDLWFHLGGIQKYKVQELSPQVCITI